MTLGAIDLANNDAGHAHVFSGALGGVSLGAASRSTAVAWVQLEGRVARNLASGVQSALSSVSSILPAPMPLPSSPADLQASMLRRAQHAALALLSPRSIVPPPHAIARLEEHPLALTDESALAHHVAAPRASSGTDQVAVALGGRGASFPMLGRAGAAHRGGSSARREDGLLMPRKRWVPNAELGDWEGAAHWRSAIRLHETGFGLHVCNKSDSERKVADQAAPAESLYQAAGGAEAGVRGPGLLAGSRATLAKGRGGHALRPGATSWEWGRRLTQQAVGQLSIDGRVTLFLGTIPVYVGETLPMLRPENDEDEDEDEAASTSAARRTTSAGKTTRVYSAPPVLPLPVRGARAARGAAGGHGLVSDSDSDSDDEDGNIEYLDEPEFRKAASRRLPIPSAVSACSSMCVSPDLGSCLVTGPYVSGLPSTTSMSNGA